jgi:hypothetical protein
MSADVVIGFSFGARLGRGWYPVSGRLRAKAWCHNPLILHRLVWSVAAGRWGGDQLREWRPAFGRGRGGVGGHLVGGYLKDCGAFDGVIFQGVESAIGVC